MRRRLHPRILATPCSTLCKPRLEIVPVWAFAEQVVDELLAVLVDPVGVLEFSRFVLVHIYHRHALISARSIVSNIPDAHSVSEREDYAGAREHLVSAAVAVDAWGAEVHAMRVIDEILRLPGCQHWNFQLEQARREIG